MNLSEPNNAEASENKLKPKSEEPASGPAEEQEEVESGICADAKKTKWDAYATFGEILEAKYSQRLLHAPVKTKIGPSGTARAEELCSCSHVNCQWLSTSKAEAHRDNICYHNHMPMDFIRKRMAEEYKKMKTKSPADREASEKELKQMAQELEEALKHYDPPPAPKAQPKAKGKAKAKADAKGKAAGGRGRGRGRGAAAADVAAAEAPQIGRGRGIKRDAEEEALEEQAGDDGEAEVANGADSDEEASVIVKLGSRRIENVEKQYLAHCADVNIAPTWLPETNLPHALTETYNPPQDILNVAIFLFGFGD